MGAQPTPKVQKFLSYVDILPPPVIKFGSKTLYERPDKEFVKEIHRNPYHINAQLDRFMYKVLE